MQENLNRPFPVCLNIPHYLKPLGLPVESTLYHRVGLARTLSRLQQADRHLGARYDGPEKITL